MQRLVERSRLSFSTTILENHVFRLFHYVLMSIQLRAAESREHIRLDHASHVLYSKWLRNTLASNKKYARYFHITETIDAVKQCYGSARFRQVFIQQP